MADTQTTLPPPQPLAPAATDERGTIHERQPTIGDALRNGWANRYLLGWLGARMLIKQYARTKLGRAWLLTRPLLDTAGKAFIFGGVLGATAPGGQPYFLFVLIGMTGWIVFEQTLTWASRAFDRYRKLLRIYDFHPLLVPVSATSTGFVQGAAYLLVATLTVLYYVLVDGTLWLDLGVHSLFTLAGFCMLLLLAWGLGLWITTLNAYSRDIRYALPYGLQIWMFVTPIIYPLEQLPAGFQFLAWLNPMTAPIELFKHGILGPDAAKVTEQAVLVSLGLIVVSLVSGLWFMNSRLGLFHAVASYDDEEEEEL